MTVHNYKKEMQQLERLKKVVFEPKSVIQVPDRFDALLSTLSLEEQENLSKYISSRVQSETKDPRVLSENIVLSMVLRKKINSKKTDLC